MKSSRLDLPAPRTIELVAEQQLHISSSGEENQICITDNTGKSILTIQVTCSGPVLTLGTDSLTIRVKGELNLDAEKLNLHGRQGVRIASDDKIDIQAAGDVHSNARTQRITAKQGNVELEANDDVTLDGLRIRLNC